MSTEHEIHSWNAAFKAIDDTKLLQVHIDEYARMTQACVEKVSRLWNEIGLPRAERQKEFDEVSTAIRNVWSATVDRAERKKRERYKEIEEAVSEIYRIKEELGDCTKDSRKQGIEGLLKLDMIVGSSLHARYEAIQELLREWRSQRSKREAEFKELQGEINNLKLRFGDVVIAPSLSPRKSDISLENLQKLSEELEQCKAEKLRRERELAALLSKLRSATLPLGENDIEIAATAHPSLRFYREALPVRPSFSNQPGLQRNIRPEDVELDLSDQTFSNLEEKILEVYDLRAAREKQTSEVAKALKYLWDILEIPEDDLERGMLMRSLEGPTRLHLQSIEKCKNEIRQMETAKAKQLSELIERAQKELQEICTETMLPMPQLYPLLAVSDSDDDSTAPVGKISEALSKLRKMIDDTRELSVKRGPVIDQITQLEHTREEVAWLIDYEKDADRYKGRDLHKKLERAQKAGRMRDKFPEFIKRLKKAVSKWEQEERRPFVYHGQDYNVVLDNMLAELSRNEPQAKNGGRRQGSSRRAPSRSAYTPPPPVNCSTPPMDSSQTSSTGAQMPSAIPSTSQTSGQRKNKEEIPEGSNTAPLEEKGHAPDGEHGIKFSGRRSWGSGSSIRPPRGFLGKSADVRNVLQTSSPGSYGYSPQTARSQTATTFNPCYNMAPCDEEQDSAKASSKKEQTSKVNLLFAADNQHDSDFNMFGPFRDPNASKRNSPGGDRQGGASGSTPNRGSRSTGSSRLSSTLEHTEGRPC